MEQAKIKGLAQMYANSIKDLDLTLKERLLLLYRINRQLHNTPAIIPAPERKDVHK